MKRIVSRWTLGVAAAGVLAALLATPAAASSNPATRAIVPAAVNDFGCQPTSAHPRPVVLLHGTFGNMTNFGVLAPQLTGAGFCVFALNYGCQSAIQLICGTAPIEDSARELSAFVDRVLAATGARQVDIVGHSQGGMMPRQYLKFLGGAAKVHRLVGLAPSNHGTTLSGLQQLAAAFLGATAQCPACLEQLAGSAFLTNLNAGGDTVAGVLYTVIETRFDEVITPFTSAFLSGPAVTNILLQDTCASDVTGHISITADPNAIGWVRSALDPNVPAPACTPFVSPL